MCYARQSSLNIHEVAPPSAPIPIVKYVRENTPANKDKTQEIISEAFIAKLSLTRYNEAKLLATAIKNIEINAVVTLGSS